MMKIKDFICNCRSGGPSVDMLYEKSNGLTPVRRVAVAFIVIALVMTVMPTATDAVGTATFSDVPLDNWAYPYVEAAAARGWVTGTGNGLFSPEQKLSTAELCAVLVRTYYPKELAEAETETDGPYWWSSYMQVAIETRILTGDTDVGENYKANGVWNKDMVEAPVTRYDVANIISSVCTLHRLMIKFRPDSALEKMLIEAFPGDGEAVFNYDIAERNSVGHCYELGIMTGNEAGEFNGLATLSRAEMATAVSRLYEVITGENILTSSPETSVSNDIPKFKFVSDYETVIEMMVRLNNATPPAQEGFLSNGEPITEDNIKNMINDAIESFGLHSTWDGSDRFIYRNPGRGAFKLPDGPNGFGGCLSFAYAMSDYIFGEDAPVYIHQDFDNVKPGDVVWAKNHKNSEGPDEANGKYGHAVLVISKPDSLGYCTTIDANPVVCDPSFRSFGKTWNEDFMKNSYVFSRYK